MKLRTAPPNPRALSSKAIHQCWSSRRVRAFVAVDGDVGHSGRAMAVQADSYGNRLKERGNKPAPPPRFVPLRSQRHSMNRSRFTEASWGVLARRSRSVYQALQRDEHLGSYWPGGNTRVTTSCPLSPPVCEMACSGAILRTHSGLLTIGAGRHVRLGLFAAAQGN